MSADPTWGSVRTALGQVLASQADADEWIREALEALFGKQDESELERLTQHDTLHRLNIAVKRLRAVPDDLGFTIGVREIVASIIWQCINDGVPDALQSRPLEGPPWRLDPSEGDRPTHDEWASAADFDPSCVPARQRP